MRTICSAWLVLSFAVLTQISSAQAPAPAPDLPPPGLEFENPADAYGNNITTRADQMLQSKDYAGAMALLTENFDRFTALRAALFGRILDVHLNQGNIKDARSLYLQYAQQDKELGRAGAEKIYSYYLAKKDNQAVIEWTKQLTALPLPDDLKPQVYSWHLKAICAEGVPAEARGLIKDCAGKFNGETCRTIILPTLAPLIESGKYDDAGRLLDAVEKEGKAVKELNSLAALNRARILLLKNEWRNAETFAEKSMAVLSDDDLAGLISFAASKAKKNGEYEAVDRICLSAIGKNKAKNQAADASLNMLNANNKLADIPGRLDQFMAMGMEPGFLFTLYCQHFYPVVLVENKDLTRQMLAFGAKLDGKLNDLEDKKQMATILMDGLFTADDYAGALQIIDANEKYWTKDWLDSTRAKIGAHLALQKNDYKAAVDGFKKYMDSVAKENIVARHPVSGQIYTANMLLGVNALRIGDILRDNLKDEDGARKSYDEAEQYFKKAITEIKPNSKESQYIDENMAKLAERKKK